MIISLINHTHGRERIEDAEVQRVVRAVNRQIEGDFAPYWSLSALLRLEGPVGARPSRERLSEMRGDAVLYLWDALDPDDALGYHDLNHRGIPYGFVFTELSRQVGEHWSTTLSHEALELIADPDVNLLVAGPHPRERGRDVFHWYEMCDAVQAESYEIDGVAVSNFVLPLYFTGDDEVGSRNDFLGAKKGAPRLRSFGVNPGGYVGFFDPERGEMDTVAADDAAKRRLEIKGTAALARRGIRYRRFRVSEPEPMQRAARSRRAR